MANLRCKVGDLAIVTQCARLDLVGSLVLVAEPAATDGRDWIVALQGGGIVAPGAFTGIVTRRNRMLTLDAWLTPIRGDEEWARDACTTLISRSLDALRDVAPRVPLDFDKITATFRSSEVL